MSFDALSRRLKIPTRTLKRTLRKEGTSYRQIVDELRTQLAIKYLRDTALTVEDVASCLGFSDAASFRRAFERWTKETPSEMRRRQLSN
jgi:AraC-like DNA-binding protein